MSPTADPGRATGSTRWRLVLGGDDADGIGTGWRGRSEPLGRRPAPRRGARGAVRRRTRRGGLGALGAAGGALARRHPRLLPVLGGAGDAGRRHGPARPAAAAARAGDDAVGAARRRPGQHAGRPGPGDPRALARDRPGRGPHGDRPARGAAARARRCRPSPGRSTGRPAPAGPGSGTSTGTAPSPRTSSTTSPSTGRSCPSGWSATPGAATRSSATSSCASTSPGSMAESVVYSSVFGAVLASLRSVRTRLVVFDTEVVDLTDELDDPGRRAVRRPARRRHRHQPGARLLPGPDRAADRHGPGADQRPLRGRHRRGDAAAGRSARRLRRHRVALLALSDSGHPSYDADHAAALAGIGVPAFACTPDLFPDLMAAAIERRDLSQWAAGNDLVTTHE